MFELLATIFEWAVSNITEPSLILLIIISGVLIFAGSKLAKTISKVYKESVESHDKITKTLVAIDFSMRNMNKILASLSDGINTLTKPNEILLEHQARLVYSLLMDDLFSELEDLYIDTNSWLNKKKLNRSDEAIKQKITRRANLHSVSQLKQLSSRLQQFKFGGFYLDRYINTEFKLELNRVNTHILTLLLENENGIKPYLSDKKLLFNSDFIEYLRDSK